RKRGQKLPLFACQNPDCEDGPEQGEYVWLYHWKHQRRSREKRSIFLKRQKNRNPQQQQQSNLSGDQASRDRSKEISRKQERIWDCCAAPVGSPQEADTNNQGKQQKRQPDDPCPICTQQPGQ